MDINEKIVHFVFDVTVGFTDQDFDSGKMPEDNNVIEELAKDNLRDVMHDWVSDGIDPDEEALAIWIDEDPLAWSMDRWEELMNIDRLMAVEALMTRHPNPTLATGNVDFVEPLDDGNYRLQNVDGESFILNDTTIEMIFAAYTEGKSFTIEEWEEWANG